MREKNAEEEENCKEGASWVAQEKIIVRFVLLSLLMSLSLMFFLLW